MTKEKDLNHSIVSEINGLVIVRSEAMIFDEWEQKFKGQTKVYYDVCDNDGNFLVTFKSVKEAKRFCESY